MSDETCGNCGGKLENKRIVIDRRVRGRLFSFEDVPAGVCGDCAQVWLAAEVLEAMEASIGDTSKPTRVVEVPSISLAHLRAA